MGLLKLDDKMINRFKGQHSFLSNFCDAVIVMEGKVYPSSENAYQAAKCAKPQDKVQFQTCTAGQAKRLGQQVRKVPKFDEYKVGIMFNIVRYKFANNPELKKMLLATGDSELVEGNHWHDTFWGVCEGVGENNLGKILMRVREELK